MTTTLSTTTMNPDTSTSMPDNSDTVQTKPQPKKRGRPSNVEKFRKTLTDKTWANGEAPLVIASRIKELDRNNDVNAWHLFKEWKV